MRGSTDIGTQLENETSVLKKEYYMYVVYDNVNAPPPSGVPFRPVLLIAPAQWAAPYGEDLAAGETWRSTPDSRGLDLPGQLRSVTLLPNPSRRLSNGGCIRSTERPGWSHGALPNL